MESFVKKLVVKGSVHPVKVEIIDNDQYGDGKEEPNHWVVVDVGIDQSERPHVVAEENGIEESEDDKCHGRVLQLGF